MASTCAAMDSRARTVNSSGLAAARAFQSSKATPAGR